MGRAPTVATKKKNGARGSCFGETVTVETRWHNSWLQSWLGRKGGAGEGGGAKNKKKGRGQHAHVGAEWESLPRARGFLISQKSIPLF
jgi:hypothetical protein